MMAVTSSMEQIKLDNGSETKKIEEIIKGLVIKKLGEASPEPSLISRFRISLVKIIGCYLISNK